MGGKIASAGSGVQEMSDERGPTMRTFAEKPTVTRKPEPLRSAITVRGRLGHSPEVDPIRRLQQTAGNQAVLRILNAREDSINAEISRIGHNFSRTPAFRRPSADDEAKQQKPTEFVGAPAHGRRSSEAHLTQFGMDARGGGDEEYQDQRPRPTPPGS